MAGAAERGDVACAGDALQVRFRRRAPPAASRSRTSSGSSLQKVSVTMGTSSMPFGLTIGWPHAEVGRHPVAVGVDGVVEAHQRLDRIFADLVLHGDHRHAGARHRIDVLDAGDARQHLLGRPGDKVLDVLDRRPREGDEDVGHGHVDLRLFLARRDQRGEDAEQQRDQRDAAASASCAGSAPRCGRRCPSVLTFGGCFSSMPVLTGSRLTVSPVARCRKALRSRHRRRLRPAAPGAARGLVVDDHIHRADLATAQDGVGRHGEFLRRADNEMHACRHARHEALHSAIGQVHARRRGVAFAHPPSAGFRCGRRRASADFREIRSSPAVACCASFSLNCGMLAMARKPLGSNTVTSALPGRGQFAEFGVALRDDAGDRRSHRCMRGAGAGRTGLGTRRFQIGIRLVEGRLADEFLLEQILACAGNWLPPAPAGRAPQQRFPSPRAHRRVISNWPGLDALAGFDLHIDDATGNLCRHRRLARRLEHRLGGQGQRHGAHLEGARGRRG